MAPVPGYPTDALLVQVTFLKVPSVCRVACGILRETASVPSMQWFRIQFHEVSIVGVEYSVFSLELTASLIDIAKTMRKGRQEDSHEFLRYAVDALQKSCLAGHPQ